MKSMEKAAYKNAELSIEERVADLLPRMSLEQKIAQLNCLFANGGVAPDMEQMKEVLADLGVL